jgi:hypothetical protein
MPTSSGGMSHRHEAPRAYNHFFLQEAATLFGVCINPLYWFVELAPMGEAPASIRKTHRAAAKPAAGTTAPRHHPAMQFP